MSLFPGLDRSLTGKPASQAHIQRGRNKALPAPLNFLLPPRTCHGKLWKAKCVEIGAEPQRRVTVGRDNAGTARKFFAALKGLFAAE